MTKSQLNIYATELDAPAWTEKAAAELIDVIAGNPWQPVVEMQASVRDPWVRFDRARAIETFAAKLSLIARSGPDLDSSGSLSSFQQRNVARLSIMSTVFDRATPADVEHTIERMLAAMPHASYASASADHDQMMFKRERDLKILPKLFGEIGWLHVVCPRSYPAFFARETLLEAPCHRIEERTDGSIWMWVYPHPLEFATAAARDANATLNKYLAEHAKKLA